MSQNNQNGSVNRAEELKKELFELEEKRKKIENELQTHKIVLETNKVGMREPLVDKDDFPRNDIDIFAVRHARSNIIRLDNDAKELLETMKVKLEELHSVARNES